MLTLCCTFIEYNKDVKRTLNSFQEFVNEAKTLEEDLKISILGVTSNRKDLQNNELISLVNNIEFIPKKGVYSAYNFSVKKSFFYNSKWLWIIGGGDTVYKPNIKLLNILKSDKYNEKIIVGSMIIGNRKNKHKQHYPYTKLWQNIDKMRLNHPAMIISNLTYKKIGFYNENLKMIADYEWCIKALKANTKFIKLGNNFTYHELGGISTRYGKSRILLHLSCIKILIKHLRLPHLILFALASRLIRFLFSRSIHYSKLILSNATR